DYSRLLTQHAIRMVQRNLTPGGDKNGADITMALDALELAFTHDHINTFVIVGGDSDFISLVEKLKQYGRKVIVVGGRQFTSVTMQKNCHEFIAYENLAGTRGGRPAGRGARPSAGTSPIAGVLPLVRRALEVLSDRELTPQLGLLKSTLLQLDSTFSEREYGAGSFRDFMEKVAAAGAVTLRNAGRSILVETRDEGAPPESGETPAAASDPQASVQSSVPSDEESDEEETLPSSPMTLQDGIRTLQKAFTESASPPRWPLYVRQAKQFLRVAVSGFDERNYGFASVVDLLRAAGKDGVLRVERDRHGAIRVFPGPKLTRAVAVVPEPEDVDDGAVDAVAEPVDSPPVIAETVAEPPIVEAQTDDVTETAQPVERPKRARGRRGGVKPPQARVRTARPARPRPPRKTGRA
ncbi:MAG: NYN domain-containing protein, partial [Vicinamibacterales bacterium]